MQKPIINRLMDRVWENGTTIIANEVEMTYAEVCKECGAVAKVEMSKGHHHLPKGHKEECLVGIVEDSIIQSEKMADILMDAIDKIEDIIF